MRIAVTGIGLVCPAGVGLDVALARLDAGPLEPEEPDTPRHARRAAPMVLRVPNFKARDWLRRRKDLKLMARANQLAVAAAKLAVTDAGLDDADLTDAGLFLGVGREPGGVDDILPALQVSVRDGEVDMNALVDVGMSRINPLSSLKTLPNMSLAHAAINLGTMGPSQALCASSDSGPHALREAAQAIVDGLAPMALAGAADERINFHDRIAATRLGEDAVTSEAAAVFVLEPEDVAKARGARIYGYVEPHSGEPRHPDVFGQCGAARAAVGMALALGRGQVGAHAPIALRPQPKAPAFLRTPEDVVVVTGVGMRTPLGNDFDTFRDALLSGHSATAAIRSFQAVGFPVKNACEVTDFDSAELPDSLRQAMAGLDDRKGEFALASALAAIESHGAFDPAAGAIYATGLSSVSMAELAQDFAPFVDSQSFDYVAFNRAATPARPQLPQRHLVDRPLKLLRDHLQLTGPNACHFSACAAGTAAIAHAADLIRRGEAPMMLAGGADSMVHPFGLLPFILLGATTTEADPMQAGRPFDRDRNGFVMGEGGAFFVLEKLSSARAAGRRIYGTILGAGTSVDAYNVTAPHPEGKGAVRAMRAALAAAGLERVDYINAHGTGTALNDVIESAAVCEVFGPDAPPMSSSKGQFGHTIAAAGAVELLACLAAFDGERLPPNARLQNVDPQVQAPMVPTEGQAGAPATILSNSFGFGGQNACLVLGHPQATGSKP